MKQYNNSKSRQGFTLIELLVAIAIVGVLATVTAAILNPFEQFKKTRDAQRKHDLRQLQPALQAYYEDNGRFPAADDKQIKDAPWGNTWQPYMAKLPKDPLSTRTYLYESDANGTYYRLHAKLENCKDPQMIPGANCTDPYNYSVTSSNIAVAIFTTPAPTPTPTLAPKRVFVTSTTYNGNLGGLTGGDAKCQTRADAASLGGTWNAWLSTSTVDAKNRVLDIEYKRLDGVVVTDSKAQLIDGEIDNPINKDENNNSLGTHVWTGTSTSGRSAGNPNCSNWTSRDGPPSSSGEHGYSANRDRNWTDVFDDWCYNSKNLYCFEQ